VSSTATRVRTLLVPALALLLGGCGRSYLNLGAITDPLAADSVEADLFLIGDAGHPAPEEEPVLNALQQQIAQTPGRSLVVFLGDNVYPAGLPDSTAPERETAEWILRAQMEPLLETRTPGIFVPGNHDWGGMTPAGWGAVLRQERFVETHGQGLIQFLPDGGCPGPVARDVGQSLRLLVVDTHWWLHRGPKPLHPGSPCRADEEEELVEAIRADLRQAWLDRRHAIVVAHHPLASGGHHGGYFDWPTYLFPFHPWARLGGYFADQDVSGEEYRDMRLSFARAFRDHPPLVYAAGHEHNLQVLHRGPARYLLVSGGGIYNHTTPVRAITGTQYANSASGFMRLSVLRNGNVRLAVVVVDAEGKAREEFATWLVRLAGNPAAQDTVARKP
jgi:hypothetical protein